jgi:hypothetical protein
MPQLRDIPNLAGMEEHYNFLISGKLSRLEVLKSICLVLSSDTHQHSLINTKYKKEQSAKGSSKKTIFLHTFRSLI